MKPADEREEVIFREALKRASRPEREAFLDGACVGNPALRARLDALLESPAGSETVVDPPAAPIAAATALAPVNEGPGTVIGRYKL